MASKPLGIALTLGLNEVDPGHYPGVKSLGGCENDARAFGDLVRDRGFSVQTLLSRDATRDALARAVIDKGGIAERLNEAGGIFVLFYAGHGSQMPDSSGEEPDRMDETWCLYDGMLVDDELVNLFGFFNEKVRVLMVSDSCHSGTVSRDFIAQVAGDVSSRSADERLVPLTREVFEHLERGAPRSRDARSGADVTNIRTFDREVRERVLAHDRAFYDRISEQLKTNRLRPKDLKTSVMLMAGCRDDQVSMDDGTHGVFTRNLLEVWDQQKSRLRDYRELLLAVRERMSGQEPQINAIGRVNVDFVAERPFTI